MVNVKTAISLPESLFEQAETLANEMKLSRSRLMALALEEFIRRHGNRQLLEKINAAYSEADALDEEEEAILGSMRQSHRQIIESNGD
jgi:metal-responsive CopG/Arc/MetJ family transcriptional regulator